VKPTEVEWEWSWRLHRDTCGFGQIELLTQPREGGIGITEAMEKDQDVGWRLCRRRCTRLALWL
jgi:hypothetical protein